MQLDPLTTAFVAVHFEQDVVGANGALAQMFHEQVAARDVLDRTRRLMAAARGAGAATVFTRAAWAQDLSDLNANSPLLSLVATTRCMLDGDPGAEIVPEVGLQDEDQVVTHQRVGGFTGSDLAAVLQSRGATTLVFCGVATNASLEGTARQASDLGYRTIVVEDACSAATPTAHASSIESLGLLAEITTVDEIVNALDAASTNTS